MAELGVLLPTREAAMRRHHDLRPVLDFAADAAALGFRTAWAGDSLLARPRGEPFTVLAAVAGAAPTLTLGTATYLPALRHPLHSAHQIATLDQLTGGRVIVGVGAGFPYPATQLEFDALHLSFERRAARLAEIVDIWRAIWSTSADGQIDFDGEFYRLDGVPPLAPPAQRDGPPVWIAAASPWALRQVGRRYDGWMPYPPTAADLGQGLQHARAHATRPFATAVYLTVCIDGADASAQLDAFCRDYYGFGSDIMGQLQAMFAGSPAACAEWIRGYVEAGATHVIVRFADRDSRSALSRFAEKVLPTVGSEHCA